MGELPLLHCGSADDITASQTPCVRNFSAPATGFLGRSNQKLKTFQALHPFLQEAVCILAAL